MNKQRLISSIKAFDRAREAWETAAMAYYRIHPKQIFGPREGKLIPFLESEDVILDLGCGNGKTLKALVQHCKGGIGIEMDKRKFRRIRRRFQDPKVQHILGHIEEELPKLKGQYTLVVMTHVLEHIKEPVALLKGLDCNKLLVIVPTLTWEYRMRADLGMRPTRVSDHYKEYTPEILRQELEDSNWYPEVLEYTEEEEILCFARRKK